MKNSFTYPVLCCALLTCTQYAWCADEPSAQNAQAQPIGRKESVLLNVTASIESIDLTNREVTLKGPLGNEVTFIVDKRVKRFNEFKVGDLVQADYYVSVAAELRKPTEEEEKTPFALLEVAGKAPGDEAPAVGGLRRFKVVTTIEGLDRPTRTVTVKGPRGRYLTARVENISNLPKMRIGENIVITYSEALAISLEKAEKPAKKETE
jgi:hypothetical protein